MMKLRSSISVFLGRVSFNKYMTEKKEKCIFVLIFQQKCNDMYKLDKASTDFFYHFSMMWVIYKDFQTSPATFQIRKLIKQNSKICITTKCKQEDQKKIRSAWTIEYILESYQ